MNYDIVIVGGGPAGLTAGMYASRRAMRTLILTKDVGGQAATTSEIENYPGIDFIDGFQLMQQFKDQAEKHGAEILPIEATALKTIEGGFEVHTPQDIVTARVVVLAFGLTPRDLGVPGESRLKGRGVSYCVTCDGPLYRGKRVAVVGGGNAALEAAEFLSKIASEVHLIHARPAMHGAKVLLDKVMAGEKIVKHLGHKPVEIIGDDRVTGIKVENPEPKVIDVDGVFVEIGHIAKTDWLRGVIELDARGQIVADKHCRTSVAGIFAAGDIADIDYKQVVISAGEGAKAALEAYKYLAQGEGKTIVPDWGFAKDEDEKA